MKTTNVEFPCGLRTVGPIRMLDWEEHMDHCHDMECALAADQAKLESMGAFDQ